MKYLIPRLFFMFVIALPHLSQADGTKDFNKAVKTFRKCMGSSRISGNYDTNGILYATFPILPFDTIGVAMKNRKLNAVLFDEEASKGQIVTALDEYIDGMSWEQNYNEEVRNLNELMNSDSHECSDEAIALYEML